MEKLKCMYLCAKEHRIDNGFFEFFYNDIEEFEGITHCCSCQEVDLSKYDVFIATPPCNYYSRAPFDCMLVHLIGNGDSYLGWVERNCISKFLEVVLL